MSRHHRAAARRFRTLAAIVSIGFPGQIAHAVDGVWSNTNGGNWSDPANWQGQIVADGPGATANFLTDIIGTQDIFVDASGRVIGYVKFGDFDPSTQGYWALRGGLLDFQGADASINISGQTLLFCFNALRADGGLIKSGAGQMIILGDLNIGGSGLRVDEGTISFRAAPSTPVNVTLSPGTASTAEMQFNGDGAVPLAGGSISVLLAGNGQIASGYVASKKTGVPIVNRLGTKIALADGVSGTIRAYRDPNVAKGNVPGYVRFTNIELGAGSTLTAQLAAGEDANAVHDIALLGSATYNNTVLSNKAYLGDVTSAVSGATLNIAGTQGAQLVGRLSGTANLQITSATTTMLMSKTTELGPSASFAFVGGGHSIDIQAGTTQMLVDPAAALAGGDRGAVNLTGTAGAVEMRFNTDGAGSTGRNLDVNLASGRPLTAFVNHAAAPTLAEYAAKIRVQGASPDAFLRADRNGTTGTIAGLARFSDVSLADGASLQLDPSNDVTLLADITAGPAGARVRTSSGTGRVYIGDVHGGTLEVDAFGNAPLKMVGRLESDVLASSSGAGTTLTSLSMGGYSSSFEFNGHSVTVTGARVELRVNPGQGAINLAPARNLRIYAGSSGSGGVTSATSINLDAGAMVTSYADQSGVPLVNDIGARINVNSTSATLKSDTSGGSPVPSVVHYSDVRLADGSTLNLIAGKPSLIADLSVPAGNAFVQQTVAGGIVCVGNISGPGTLTLANTPGNQAIRVVGTMSTDVTQSNSAGVELTGIEAGTYKSAFSLGSSTLSVMGGTAETPVALRPGANPGTGGRIVVYPGGYLSLHASAAGALVHNGGNIAVNADQDLRYLKLNGDYALDLNGFNLVAHDLEGTGRVTNHNSAAESRVTLDVASEMSFDGVIADGAGRVSVAKTGAGELSLWGTSTHTGATSVNAGTLLVRGAIAYSDVTVASSATLGGTGTLGGSATILGGARIAPGDGIGTLTLGALNLEDGAILDFQLGNGLGDKLLITKNDGLAVDGPATFQLSALGSLSGGSSYTLLSYAGAPLSDSMFALLSATGPAPYQYELSNDSAGRKINLLVKGVSAIHEWKNDVDGNWSEPANWSSGIDPNAPAASVRLGNAIQSARTIAIDGDHTVGKLEFENQNRYTLSGAGRLSLNNNGATATVRILGGAHAIFVPLSLADSGEFDISSGARLDLADVSLAPSKSLKKIGNGTLSASGANGISGDATTSVDVQEGKLQTTLLHTGSLHIGAGARIEFSGPAGAASALTSLDIASIDGKPAGTLDLGASELVVRSSDPVSLLPQIADLVRSARSASPHWSGFGITSSAAAADDLMGLAVILNRRDDGKPLLDKLGQEQLDANSIVVKYSLNGDTNLDGIINFDDYFQINTGFLSNGALSGYRNGDFDYSGIINFDDYFLINTAFLGQSSHASAPQIERPAIPEPSALAIAAACCAALLAGRQRKRGCEK